ncbi:hypothetical protein K469DRAFT_267122 [Zopfia rhizophila CBS 207.26]|uniref:Uncharacterized protein n=1 Tax=Zopfia rhizophila CBS 207.26 TaxID=1314779 RepID=A0A6A6DN65_9PEZI|nr:hypothetical protein K469DRAFT_267122 [Zopfia rhizophila CBS 207.26]
MGRMPMTKLRILVDTMIFKTRKQALKRLPTVSTPCRPCVPHLHHCLPHRSC